MRRATALPKPPAGQPLPDSHAWQTLRTLFPYLWQYRLRVSLALACLIGVQVCLNGAMAGLRMAAPLLALRLGYSTAAVGVLLALFAFIMIGIYGGLFTPIEAAGMGAFAALIIAGLTGGLTRPALWAAFLDSATASAMIFAIIIGAEIFSNFVTFAGLPDSLSQIVEGLGRDLLAQIDPTVYQTRVLGDQAQLDNLRAQLAQQKAQLELDRLRDRRASRLLATQAGSQDTADAAAATVRIDALARVGAVFSLTTSRLVFTGCGVRNPT